MALEQQFESGVGHHQAGRLAEAEEIYRQILALDPNHAQALHHLGVLVGQTGRSQEALGLIRQAIGIKPDYAEAHNNLGNTLKSTGRLDDAIASYQQAIQLNADYALAHFNLANALKSKGDLNQAIVSYRQAIRLKPDLAAAHNNLGNLFKDLCQLHEAIASYQQAIGLKPELAEAHNNLGSALTDIGQLDQAIAASRRAIALRPDYAEAHFNLGNALTEIGQKDEAIASYRQAIALNPDHAGACNNLGNALKDTGLLDEAIVCYRRAIAIAPNFAMAHDSLLYSIQFHPGYDEQTIRAEQRSWNQQLAQPLKHFIRPHDNDRDPDRRLRIGYVSPDFRHHAESFFIVPLLEHHNHQPFEIHCYSSVRRPDEITQRNRRASDVWHEVHGWGDHELAEQIRQDRIDILVDLTMHMGNSRLLAFARKPAPVQISWLAYPGSTGLPAIDYRLSDRFLDPPDSPEQGDPDRPIPLPDCWVCYDPLTDIEPPPARRQIADRPLCFGSLNNPCKINEPLLRLWAQVLQAVPASRLLMLVLSANHQQRIVQFMGTLGTSPGRLEFVGLCGRSEYLQLYERIDICLDTLPYNGITTTCDALWMGVPVISLIGNTSAGRAGQGILSTLGLVELIAHTPQQYVQIAASLADDSSRLSELHRTLSPRMRASPLMDARRFVGNVEAAYRHAWQTWCAQNGNQV